MSFTITEILGVAALLGSLIMVYVTVRKALVKLEVDFNYLREQWTRDRAEYEAKIIKLETILETERNARNQDNSELWKKLITIETNQAEMNVYLKENLKHVMQLLGKHDEQIKRIDERMV